MENDILDALQDIGYSGPLKEEIALVKTLEAGPKSTEFTKLVAELAGELRQLCGFEEMVNATKDADEASTFLLELSSFLKEMGCPYISMVTGHISSRLQTREDRMLLLDYLLSELMAARMINTNKPTDKSDKMEITIQESPTAKDLKEILITLGVNKPPPNITPEMLFSKIEEKLRDAIQKKGATYTGKSLYNKAIRESQWNDMLKVFNDMYEEFRMRREMLITRLDCTIRSFEWSDRTKLKRDHIQKAYQPLRDTLKVRPEVKFSDFLAARDALLHVEKTSSANVRKNTRSEVNKVIIGQVPDRGGRSWEQEPPPPEMPSWQQNRSKGGGGGGGHGGGFGGGGRGGGFGGDRGNRGGGGRGGGGGRVQGGWNQQGSGDNLNNRNQGGGFSRDGAHSQSYQSNNQGYQSQGQGYQSGRGYQSNQGSQNNQGYQSSLQGNYQSANQGYQSQNSSGYNSGSYTDRYSQNAGRSNQSQGYQSQSQPYQGQTHGYQHQGGQSGQHGAYGRGAGGNYQNEHDDRTSNNYGGHQRSGGRSNYGRGGRY